MRFIHCLLLGLFLVSPATGLRAENAVFADGAKPKLLINTGAGEGPAWHPHKGLFTSGGGHIYLYDQRTGKQTLFHKAAGTNGLLFDSQGRLLACEPVLRRVTRTARNGNITVLSDNYKGKKYNQPNDISVDSQGRIYFSDPKYGSRENMELVDEQGRKIEGVYRIDSDGTVTRIIAHEVDRPNGLLVTPDDKFLYVADNNNNTVGGAHKLWRFHLRNNGTVDFKSQKLIFDWGTERGPDGMALDLKGRLYVAGGREKPVPPYETASKHKAGVYVFSSTGKLIDFVPTPNDEATNCTFGGDDLKTLYVTAGGRLWSIRTTTPGRLVWPKLR